MTSYIICAFVSGFLMATVIFWIASRKQQKGWQAEYRRLMAGVEIARRDLRIVLLDATHRKVKLNDIYTVLDRIWWGLKHTETGEI